MSAIAGKHRIRSRHVTNWRALFKEVTLETEIARLREALEFYADEDNYIEGLEYAPVVADYGTKARAALKGATP